MFYRNVHDTRQMFYQTWHKHLLNQPLNALEQQLVQVIMEHPEYHPILTANPLEFTINEGETNPFLHMGLHLALREQLATNRPAIIQSIYQQLLKQYNDVAQVEHRMMEPLVQWLWIAQQTALPDESHYIHALKELL